MAQIQTEDYIKILNHPSIIKIWQITLHLPSMYNFLSTFFNEKTLNKFCNENLNQKEAIEKFHTQVLLQSDNNDHLFETIVIYCKEKWEILSELIEIMWIDVDEEEEVAEEKQQQNHINKIVSIPLTKDQRKNFLRHADLDKKLDNCFNKQIISSLLNEFSTDEGNNPPTGESLLELLLFSNNKRFYDKVCKLLMREQKNFENCYKFMTSAVHDAAEDQKKEEEDDDHSLSLNVTSCTADEMNSFKLQLHNVRQAVGCVLHQYTNEICEVKGMMVNVQSEIETNVNTRVNILEGTIMKFMNEMKAFVKKSDEQIVENRQLKVVFNRQEALIGSLKKDVNDLKKKNSELQESNKQMQQEIKEFKQVVASSQEKADQQMGQIQKLEAKTSALLPYFTMEPNAAMKEIQKSHKWCGLSPNFTDEWGVYPTVDWLTLGGSRKWTDQWSGLTQGKFCDLYPPPLLLPVELGGWCVQLKITWKNGLKMFGWIINDKWNNIEFVNVHFIMKLTIHGGPTFEINETFTLTRNERDLWTISMNVNKEWTIPQLNIQVLPN